jgi:hypothetical protein
VEGAVLRRFRIGDEVNKEVDSSMLAEWNQSLRAVG